MTPLNELGPQQDGKPTPGIWQYFAPEKSVVGSYDHGPMVLSKLGEHTVPIGEFDSVADAVLCSYAPEMLQTLRTVYARISTVFGEGELCKQIAAVIRGATGRR